MDKLKKKSLLVVGGTGFIGTALLKRANFLGLETTSLSLNKPLCINALDNTRYLYTDTSNKKKVEYILQDKFNYVVNLGRYIDHRLIKDGGFSIINNQLQLLNNLISTINTKTLERFIQIGSSDEYGLNKSPQEESYRENPISPYSLSKVINTQYLQMLNQTENFPSVMLRLFLVYGPYQKFDRLIPFIIKSCLENNKFSLTEGTQLKDFCYVFDVVEAIIKSLTAKNISGQIINIGSGNTVSVKEIATKIVSLIKLGNPDFNKKNSKTIENKILFPNISKSYRTLEWMPTTSLEKGLIETIAWYKNNLNL